MQGKVLAGSWLETTCLLSLCSVFWLCFSVHGPSSGGSSWMPVSQRHDLKKRSRDSPWVGISLFCLLLPELEFLLPELEFLARTRKDSVRKVVQESRTVRRNRLPRAPLCPSRVGGRRGLDGVYLQFLQRYTSPEPVLLRRLQERLYRDSRGQYGLCSCWYSVQSAHVLPFRARQGRSLTCLTLMGSFRVSVVIARGVMSSLK